MTGKQGNGLTRFSGKHPKFITLFMVLSTLALLALAGVPSLWPESAKYLNSVTIDTDPENMLSPDTPVRVYHNKMKREFSLYDIVVVGVVNEKHPDGVFNVESLKRLYELTQFARTLQWPDPANPARRIGVVETDMLAPSMVDNIEQAGLGTVKFNWLMPAPPKTRKEALAVRDRARKIPLFDGTLVSEDGKAISLYLPITSKDVSHRIRKALLGKVAGWASSNDKIYITGLPVAEDTFGVEMFKQMAISAPLAMLVIFFVLWWFFRNVRLILSPMIVAMVAAGSTMALLVITGNTVHIMSSMIPIFIMPIAVLDSVHILSEFFDRYQKTKDRRRAIKEVMDHLFMPMLFTTLTTAVGFASLALTPIPPVQVFGTFIAIGVFLAWFWTITFIPAFITFIPEEKLAGFGRRSSRGAQDEGDLMSRWLVRVGQAMFRKAKLVLALTALAVAVAGYGISLINVNDNPVKWFEPSHPIRVADRVLNKHFGGTYMAYLAIEPGKSQERITDKYLEGFLARLKTRRKSVVGEGVAAAGPAFGELGRSVREKAKAVKTRAAFLKALEALVEERMRGANAAKSEAWEEVQVFLDSERQRDQFFKHPEALRYVAALQKRLLKTGVVGKSSSLADIVKTVHRELLLGEPRAFRIPASANAVAQTLLTYQSSHRPQDLWHFVSPDYRKTSIWVQLKSGGNKDMSRVVREIDAFVAANPPPFELKTHWFGLTYINVVWQKEMVSGMLRSLLGSFVVVVVMMAVLFRSVLWGILCMIPLSVTIGLIYGMTGLIGKDYDMPIAVLSALSLGLAVDYAIHFLARARAGHQSAGSWPKTVNLVFGEPARAITRNAIVLGVGFLPLLAAPLMPYKTVGVFIAAILLTAGLGTLLILPALITVLERWLFPQPRRTRRNGRPHIERAQIKGDG